MTTPYWLKVTSKASSDKSLKYYSAKCSIFGDIFNGFHPREIFLKKEMSDKSWHVREKSVLYHTKMGHSFPHAYVLHLWKDTLSSKRDRYL